MSGLSPSALAAAREIAGTAAAPSHGEQAEHLLALLHRVVPFQAAWLALLDDDHRRYTGLAATGYDDRTRLYFGTTELLDQVDLCGLSTSSNPQSARDSPIPLDELPVWPEYYHPAGFRGGMAVGLFTQDHRHLGVLLLNTDDREQPSDGPRDLIGALAPRIAAAVDPIQSVSVLARVVHDAVAGIALTRDGAALPLPGLPEHALLTPGSTLLAAAAQQRDRGEGYVSFLWPTHPHAEADNQDDLVRVVVLDCAPQPAHPVAIVVLAAPPGGQPGLTREELTVVGLLLDGWPNQRIAVAMDLLARAVADMIERIIIRLGAPDLHIALLRAARRGWFIPHCSVGPSVGAQNSRHTL